MACTDALERNFPYFTNPLNILGGCSPIRHHGEPCSAQIECSLSRDPHLQCKGPNDDAKKCVCPRDFHFDGVRCVRGEAEFVDPKKALEDFIAGKVGGGEDETLMEALENHGAKKEPPKHIR